MSVNYEAAGKEYSPQTYEVGREKIREYAYAVGDENPIYLDEQAAKDAGFKDIVAPPMFAVVYSKGALGQAILDPELQINLMMLVHGEQEFEWHDLVYAGDTITTKATIDQIYEKANMDFVVVKSESKNQDGKPVVTGTWTEIVRRG